MQKKNIPTIVLTGMPGSGKGTQSRLILEKYPETKYIEMGQMLRSNSKKIVEGVVVQDFLDTAELVPNSIVFSLLEKEIKNYKEAGINSFLFDGFPRNESQSEYFKHLLSKQGIDYTPFYLDLSNIEAAKRMHSRMRSDDSPELISKRLISFKKEMKPVLSDWVGMKKLRTINSSIDGLTGDAEAREVFKQIDAVLCSL